MCALSDMWVRSRSFRHHRRPEKAGVSRLRLSRNRSLWQRRRSADPPREGKLRNLEEVIRLKPLDGTMHRTHPLGHARPPHRGKRPSPSRLHRQIVVVHNGIVENYLSLKKKLIAEGHRFTTETDTESSRTWSKSITCKPATAIVHYWNKPCAKPSRNSPACSRWW